MKVLYFKFICSFYKLVHRICAAVNKKESIYPFWKCHRKLYDSVLLARGHGELVEPLSVSDSLQILTKELAKLNYSTPQHDTPER